MVADTERVTALGREADLVAEVVEMEVLVGVGMEGPEVAGVVIPCVGLISL